MESSGQLDIAGRTAARKSRIPSVVLLLLLGCVNSQGLSQKAPQAGGATHIKALFEAERWGQLVQEVELSPARGAEIDYYYGSALAHLGRWRESRAAFQEGRHLSPRDERFPIELGGVAFEQKRYAEAAHWLRQGLRLAPHDAYAQNFLATVFFLEGNTEAALKYWNGVSKPELERARFEPGLRVDSALLDRAVTFAPSSTLLLPDFLTTRTRVDGLGIFPASNWRLEALENGKFDMTFQGQERDGWGTGKWQALISTFRGAIYQTAYPEYFNWGGRATNFSSLVRWDDQKRRLLVSLSGPLAQNPKYRYEVGVDLRNEDWQLRQSFKGPAPVLGALNLRWGALFGQITSLNSGRWSWLTGAELSDRDYRNVFVGPALPPEALLSGLLLKQHSRLDYQWLRVPEKRFESKASIDSQAGTIWSAPAHSSEKLQGSVSTHWDPQVSGDDYAMAWKVRSGKTWGTVPFDELFMLGMERDNDLWIRAHVGTRDGMKGSAPLGRNYFLSNWEIDKRIYRNGFFTLKLSPFLDTGKITDPLPGLSSGRWLWDAGVQAKFRVLGVGVTLVYGRDLRSGHGALYATAQ